LAHVRVVKASHPGCHASRPRRSRRIRLLGPPLRIVETAGQPLLMTQRHPTVPASEPWEVDSATPDHLNGREARKRELAVRRMPASGVTGMKKCKAFQVPQGHLESIKGLVRGRRRACDLGS